MIVIVPAISEARRVTSDEVDEGEQEKASLPGVSKARECPSVEIALRNGISHQMYPSSLPLICQLSRRYHPLSAIAEVLTPRPFLVTEVKEAAAPTSIACRFEAAPRLSRTFAHTSMLISSKASRIFAESSLLAEITADSSEYTRRIRQCYNGRSYERRTFTRRGKEGKSLVGASNAARMRGSACKLRSRA